MFWLPTPNTQIFPTPLLWPDPNTAYGYNDVKVNLRMLSPASKERNEN